MQLMLQPDIPVLKRPLGYTDHILLCGSCFTEHIADRLSQYRFNCLSNPNGILFNPLSVADSINGYLADRQYTEADLFYLNELWNCWDHHTRFSDFTQEAALQRINAAQAAASAFIKKADVIIITLGSAFQYFLTADGRPVSNNHRAPAQWFEKRLLTIETINMAWEQTMSQLQAANPGAWVIFTISPVRHIRDGVMENNRSKARLIEAVHHLCSKYERTYYFPAYELVIDVLRDYRYYDIDFVHPNYLATSYVWEQFYANCMEPATIEVMKQVQELITARQHRARFPETQAHGKFLQSHAARTRALMQQYPYLNLHDVLQYFEQGN